MGQMQLIKRLVKTKSAHQSDSEAHSSAGNSLSRSIGPFSLTMIGVGSTIGTGIFFTMVEAVPKAGPSVILSFIIAAITASLTALCYAELSARIPSSGSSYSFAYATVGEFMAFIVAACLLLEYGLAASATAIGWSEYLNNFFTNSFGWEIPPVFRTPAIMSTPNGVVFDFHHFNLPPVMLVLFCGIILTRGAKESATFNAVMVVIKLVILLFFSIVAIKGFKAEHFTPFFNTDNSKGYAGMAGVAAAAGTVFFSFIGLDTIATAGAEVRNPRRDVPLGILAALIIVTVFYLLIAVTALGAQPASKFAGQEAGLAVILKDVTGQAWPALVLSAGAVISVFSVTLVSIYGQTRILYAVSRDGLISPAFQNVHARTRVPVTNTIVVCSVVCIIAGLVDSNFLWDMVSMGTLVAFIVVSAAIPIVRRNGIGSDKGGFRVPFGDYLIPVLSILACLYIIKDLSAMTFGMFGFWMVLSIISYVAYGYRNSRLGREGA